MAAAAPVLSTCTGVERSVYWNNGRLYLIDQQALPAKFEIVSAGSQEGMPPSKRNWHAVCIVHHSIPSSLLQRS